MRSDRQSAAKHPVQIRPIQFASEHDFAFAILLDNSSRQKPVVSVLLGNGGAGKNALHVQSDFRNTAYRDENPLQVIVEGAFIRAGMLHQGCKALSRAVRGDEPVLQLQERVQLGLRAQERVLTIAEL